MSIWCEEFGQWRDEKVCVHNLELGRCDGTVGDCCIHKEPVKISDEERKRRADRMREIAKNRKSRKPRDIGDNDGEVKQDGTD
jgi:hypothetical protein